MHADQIATTADPRVARILDIVARETHVDRAALTLDATMDALGIESLDLVQTVFELESQFDIEIPVAPDLAGVEFATVGDLVSHVTAVLDRAGIQTVETWPTGAGSRS
jgi:acyl carrier protein